MLCGSTLLCLVAVCSDSFMNLGFTGESFKQEFLDTHNKYRSMHNAGPLRYNDGMCAKAQEWAEHLLQIQRLQHSGTDDGENVFYLQGPDLANVKGNKAVDSWYSEIKDYDFSSPRFQRGTGHFTQVVWKETTELGVGVASRNGMTFVVGQYRPAGNINNHGYFDKNVSRKGNI
ncbi:Golgi-associated plant pathogenesis-related protein 1-like, partial [Nothobranchius furzeri]